ncbi:Uncharacterised protein [Cedecea neteri]|uniref:Uncharacterized protein n=1 Tax=Cedecea neteri TaxID=158822 RepID=A0A2X2T303_9ENTR|nr:Uncharacterised protein [Cedecea neteri]
MDDRRYGNQTPPRGRSHFDARGPGKQIFSLDKKIKVVAEAGCGKTVLSLLTETDVDVLLLDLSIAR